MKMLTDRLHLLKRALMSSDVEMIYQSWKETQSSWCLCPNWTDSELRELFEYSVIQNNANALEHPRFAEIRALRGKQMRNLYLELFPLKN